MERQRLERLRDALRASCPDLELREREPMSRHTTFRIGGPVRLMALPKTEKEAQAVLKTAWELECPPFFLGNGSHVVYREKHIGTGKGAGPRSSGRSSPSSVSAAARSVCRRPRAP